MSKLYTDFCPVCEKFETNGSASNPECFNCSQRWLGLAEYWHDLDTWEAVHKKKISDFQMEAVSDTKGYISGGAFEKDLAVLVAAAKLDAVTEVAHKVLDIMEKEGHQNPKQALNQVAMNLGFIVADAHKAEIAAKKEAAADDE